MLFVQALLFADGGLTALGTNITLMALVGVGVAWLVIVAVRRLLPKRAGLGADRGCHRRAGLGSRRRAPRSRSCSPLGGVAEIPAGAVLIAMVGWHSLIGIGEAVITGLVVSAVVATRPDLVFAARPILETTRLEIRETGVTA